MPSNNHQSCIESWFLFHFFTGNSMEKVMVKRRFKDISYPKYNLITTLKFCFHFSYLSLRSYYYGISQLLSRKLKWIDGCIQPKNVLFFSESFLQVFWASMEAHMSFNGFNLMFDACAVITTISQDTHASVHFSLKKRPLNENGRFYSPLILVRLFKSRTV